MVSLPATTSLVKFYVYYFILSNGTNIIVLESCDMIYKFHDNLIKQYASMNYASFLIRVIKITIRHILVVAHVKERSYSITFLFPNL